MRAAASVHPAVWAPSACYEMLDKITKGQGTMEDLDKMEDLCYYIKENSLCASGPDGSQPGAEYPQVLP